MSQLVTLGPETVPENPFIRLNPKDNVVVARAPLPADAEIEFEGQTVRVAQAVGAGHQVAVKPIAQGEIIYQYGENIGVAKELTLPAFNDALSNGYNINVATSTLDGSGGRVFSSFVRGGGMDLDEMTGSPNITIVPDQISEKSSTASTFLLSSVSHDPIG